MVFQDDAGHRRHAGVKVIGVTAVRNGDSGILIGSNTDCITVTGGCDFGGSPRGSGVIVANDQGRLDPNNIIISNVHAYNNKHAGIHVKQGKHLVIAQCICSGHDHVSVHNYGQSYGIHVGPDVENVITNANITHDNGKQGVYLQPNNDK